MPPAARTIAASAHGVAAPRGDRFGRLFGSIAVRDAGLPAIDALARALAGSPASEENPDIPAGYTYLAQFVDHDITFDATSQLEGPNDPGALVNLRSPRLDLDSVYGSGPVDQPYLYDAAGTRLLLASTPPGGELAETDLQRNGAGRALIGDPRNDENLVVSQLHLLFVRLHNKVVDVVAREPGGLAGTALFEEARTRVRRHYQWLVVHDLLPKLIGRAPSPPRLFDASDAPFIPVEFSAAAYRCGHSMVRKLYAVNTLPGGTDRNVEIMPGPAHSGATEHLAGFRPLPAPLRIDWGRFFDTDPARPAQKSMRIDEHLSQPLHRLPVAFARELPADEAPATTTSLARLNLRRGHALGLPAGADVARAAGVEPLSPQQLFPAPPAGVQLAGDDVRQALLDATPLWYYLMREAAASEFEGRCLGEVGGLIVSEVLQGLLQADPESFVHEHPAWQPTLFGSGERSTMADLVTFVEDNP